MNRYFKWEAESEDGKLGECFVEVNGNLIQRQVVRFGEELHWATPDAYSDERHMFTDQPEIDEELDPLTPLDREQFELLWEKATVCR